MLVTFRTAGVPHERRKRRGKTDCMHGCPDTPSIQTSGC
jgi:hypothetical protein